MQSRMQSVCRAYAEHHCQVRKFYAEYAEYAERMQNLSPEDQYCLPLSTLSTGLCLLICLLATVYRCLLCLPPVDSSKAPALSTKSTCLLSSPLSTVGGGVRQCGVEWVKAALRAPDTSKCRCVAYCKLMNETFFGPTPVELLMGRFFGISCHKSHICAK